MSPHIQLWSYFKDIDVYFVMKVSLGSNDLTIYSELACMSRNPYQGDGMEIGTPLLYKLVKRIKTNRLWFYQHNINWLT